MESYIIFAIISAVSGGLFNLILKIAAYKKYRTSTVLLNTYISSSIIGGIVFIFKDAEVNNLWLVLFYALLNGMVYFLVHRVRIKALKNIDTTIYFPVYKTVGPIMILFVSFLFFRESLDFKEWIGVILGIVTSLLLISKSESNIQNNLKKGLALMFFGAILTTAGVGINKLVNVSGLNKELFTVASTTVLLGMTSLKMRKEKNNENEEKKLGAESKKVKYLGLINGVIVFVSAYSMVLALEGNTAIVYTINSFSILLTVLLSVIFFKEHFNFRKALAVIASVLAGIFFIK